MCLIYIKIDVFLLGRGEDILGRVSLNFLNYLIYVSGFKFGVFKMKFWV